MNGTKEELKLMHAFFSFKIYFVSDLYRFPNISTFLTVSFSLNVAKLVEESLTVLSYSREVILQFLNLMKQV